MKTIKHLFLLSAAVFLWSSSLYEANAQTLEADSLALVDLYNDCGGTNWNGFDSWLNSPLSAWEDVTVDSATQRVVHVEFSRMTLVDTLPASLGNIDKMSGKIQLNGQEGLTGELPAFLWNWVDVERFQVKFCGFTSMDVTGMENMVNLTEFNSENTPFAGTVPSAIFDLPAMEKLYLHDSEFDALPPSISSISGYTRLYLNGDNFSDLPDLSGVVWGDGAKVRVHNNSLDFADLEPNMVLTMDTLVEEFRYSPQNTDGEVKYVYADAGVAVSLDGLVPGSANIYTWIKGEDEQVGDSVVFEINSFDPATQSGRYRPIVQSSIVTGLDIIPTTYYLFESATAQDSLALVDLYNDCGGSEWVGFDTWLNGPLNTWEGVEVDSATSRVVNVGFKDMHLVGTLPATLANIDQMGGKIEFRDDTLLTGEMPALFWNWTNVERFQMKFAGYTSMDLTGIDNMVNLTEFNTEGTQISGTAPAVIFTLPAMVKIYMHDNNLDAVPDAITESAGLDRLYFNGNNITELPDLSGIVWGEGAKIRFQDNFLTFEDLEYNIPLTMDTLVEEFRYSPQGNVGEETTLMPDEGSEVNLSIEVGGTANIYSWIKGEEQVGDSSTYTIASYDSDLDAGVYYTVIQNSLVPGLDIVSNTTTLEAAVMMGSDSLALVDLYNDCGGSEWVGFDNWLNGPLNTWEKVTLDSVTGRVINVEFKDMHLVGTLPASLGGLDQMGGKIEFRDDTLLTGEMPSLFWNWVNVERFQMKFAGYTTMDLTGIENMVNLTEFNTEGTPFGGTAPGEVFILPAMVKIYFHDNNLDAVPDELTQSSGLDRLYFNGNNISELPDMSSITWGEGAKVRVQDNFLTFEDLEYNMPLTMDTLVEEFRYSPQGNVGMLDTINLNTGDTLSLSVVVGGTANTYMWVKGEDTVIDGATESNFQIDSVDVDDAGSYYAFIQNTIVTGLDIFSERTEVTVAPPSGVDEIDFEGLQVLGNPVDDRLQIKSDELIHMVSVFNANGQLVSRTSYNDARNVQVEMSNFTSGLYYVMLQNDIKYQTIKVVKK